MIYKLRRTKTSKRSCGRWWSSLRSFSAQPRRTLKCSDCRWRSGHRSYRANRALLTCVLSLLQLTRRPHGFIHAGRLGLSDGKGHSRLFSRRAPPVGQSRQRGPMTFRRTGMGAEAAVRKGPVGQPWRPATGFPQQGDACRCRAARGRVRGVDAQGRRDGARRAPHRALSTSETVPTWASLSPA